MPFNPSDLEWWAWLLIGAVGIMVSFGIFNSRNGKSLDGLFMLIGGLTGIASLLCVVLGVVRFVRWAWNG